MDRLPSKRGGVGGGGSNTHSHFMLQKNRVKLISSHLSVEGGAIYNGLYMGMVHPFPCLFFTFFRLDANKR